MYDKSDRSEGVNSTRTGTWKWQAKPVEQGGKYIVFPAKFIVDLSPDAIVQITENTPDNDDLARRIIETIETSSDPECYIPRLERMLKAMYGYN